MRANPKVILKVVSELTIINRERPNRPKAKSK